MNYQYLTCCRSITGLTLDKQEFGSDQTEVHTSTTVDSCSKDTSPISKMSAVHTNTTLKSSSLLSISHYTVIYEEACMGLF